MSETYRIKKILNNNVVSAVSGFQEVIVVGLSIGFQAKKNDKIDPRRIEKVFELKREEFYKTAQLVEEIPEAFFFEMYRLIEGVSHETQIVLDSHAYVTLIDHTNFAIERLKNGQEIRNMMNYDLSILYPEQFEFGRILLQQINAKYQINLPEDEIGFLTMHIVNGSLTDIDNKSSILTDAVFSILNIIRDDFLIALKLEDPNTQRIMIHIKMLIQRVMAGHQIDHNEAILLKVLEEFEAAYACATRIRSYIEERLQTSVNQQELVYLTIHLNRLYQISQEKGRNV